MVNDNIIKILIVEDELLIAEDMRIQLEQLGYMVVGVADSYNEAMDIIERVQPDIALVDIIIEGKKDGVEVAAELKSRLDIPIIFITSHADRATIERAKKIKPEGYLVKPFNSKDLFSSIEIAFSNYVSRSLEPEKSHDSDSTLYKDYIFIKKDYLLVKIKFDELKWIKAEGNYIEIYCEKNKFLTRSTLKDFISKLPVGLFVQVHKSYAVNVEFIDAIEFNKIIIGKEKIPLSRSLIPEIKKKLQIDF